PPIMTRPAQVAPLLRDGRSFEEYFRFEEDAEAQAKEDSVLDSGEEPPGDEESSGEGEESLDDDSSGDETEVPEEDTATEAEL
ncbi:MAG: hypothetical protein K2J49_05910, partial [Muribaculaceae bacterium]|nr:hypothetical protein [Muribaculaceae bacterium]